MSLHTQKDHYAAIEDVHVNLENRNHAFDEYGYGPLNPKEPSDDFWKKKAEVFKTTVEEAKKSRCGNCAAFNQSKEIMKRIADGLGPVGNVVAEKADLGFCEMFKFKCAAERTCDAWLVNGPITEEMNVGAIAGTGDPRLPMDQREPGVMRRQTKRGKFMNMETFIVPHSTFVGIREAKKKGKHWRTYLNEDDAYHDIREYARKKKGPIIVEDERTGACMYVRYGKGGAIHEAVENSIRSTERGWLSDAGKKARDVRRYAKYDSGKDSYLGTFKGHRVRKTSFGQGDAAYHLEDPKTGDITHSVNGSERRSILTVGGASSTGNSKIKMHDFYHHLIRKHIKALVGTSHSEGAKKVWQKLAKKPGVSLHGWHKGKAVNLDPQDEDETHAPKASYPVDRREPEEKEVASTKLVASYHKRGAKKL
jgi:hypothetical protein